MTDTLLEISHLSGGYKKGLEILQDINLTVSQGEFVAIIGLNGSGKSTLGKALMNLLPYRSGSISFDGKPVDMKKTHELSRLGIKMMHQGGIVFPNLSVSENMRLASYQRTSSAPTSSGSKRLIARHFSDTLSGGERQNLAFSMILANNPRLVILDEPSAGLSPAALDFFYHKMGLLREKGISVILIEQNITRAIKSCNRSFLMESGRLASELTGKSINEIESILFKN